MESRKLCDFEKNVLLALIGSVIQPSKFSNHEFRLSSNHAQMGDLLRLFCTNLEEQIAHRKYFYKSSSLVHEGMIVVHSSGLTGDPSTASVSVEMKSFCEKIIVYSHSNMITKRMNSNLVLVCELADYYSAYTCCLFFYKGGSGQTYVRFLCGSGHRVL